MKSIEIKFNEALAALDKAGKRDKYEGKATKLTTIEAKLNCAEETLKESRIIRKYNGSADNRGVTQEELRESGFYSEGYVQQATNPFAKADKLMVESMTHPGTKQPLTEAEKRKALGLRPVEYDALTPAKKRDYDFARTIGLSESDAFKIAAISGR